jgi:hypothetical protein
MITSYTISIIRHEMLHGISVTEVVSWQKRQFCPNIDQNGALVNRNFSPKKLLAPKASLGEFWAMKKEN